MRTRTTIYGLAILVASCDACGIPQGRFRCDSQSDCPADWYCHTDRLCYSHPEADGSVDADVDACAAAPDAPDDAFLDTNCDGIDGDASAMIFVSPDGEDGGSGQGTREHPYRTVGYGLARAVLASKTAVAIRAGTYVEHITVRDGISLYGGYGDDWSRGAQNVVEIAAPPEPSVVDGIATIEAVRIDGIHTRTVLERLTIMAGSPTEAPATLGVNVYGIRIVRSQASSENGVVLRHLHVTAGRASNGTVGANGSAGEPAVMGESGTTGGTGAMGGVAFCGGTAPVEMTRGGRGGAPATDSVFGCGGIVNATAGEGPFAAPGCRPGTPGTNYPGCGPFASFVGNLDHEGFSPFFHSCGVDMSSTRGGAAPALAVRARVAGEALHLIAEVGADGQRGPHGGGGPGGGGSGAADFTDGYGYAGGDGGGGNSGSCGGYPGRGGGGGGSSVGLFVSGSSFVSVESSFFVSSQAGAGGGGGTGGDGGANNTNSAPGGTGTNSISSGGYGAIGWRGGPGGGGGGGAGGSSIAQLVCNGTSITGVTSESGMAGPAGAGGDGANGSPSGPTGVSSAYENNCVFVP